VEIITGDLYDQGPCFVRDEIHFLNNGRLIFQPRGGKEYHDMYFVICRKLTIVGGHKPLDLFPCRPGDPGDLYKNNNVITWQDRLTALPDGSTASPPQAKDGTSFAQWSDMGQGNDGARGGDGDPGNKGNPGMPNGKKAPHFVLLALEVEIGLGDFLTIDFNGQAGSKGGRGQRGGDGGKGMHGRIGEDESWPGSGCERGAGHGGDGGDGGQGGPGGPGSKGGDAGDITIISTQKNITGGGAFIGGHFLYVNDGGPGGAGGPGGFGGSPGFGGQPGFPTSECAAALPGNQGNAGLPGDEGVAGPHGQPGKFVPQQVERDKCADMIPLSIQFDQLDPAVFCRGFSTPATGDGALTGSNLAQVNKVTTSLANINITKKITSTDTQLDLKFAIAGNSGTGTGNLTLERAFGTPATLPNVITVNRFEVTNISPNSGARNATVNVTITGKCFDPSALIQQVIVSGLGVTVHNESILDEQTITCVFEIGALAAQNARDVTVKTGSFHHTLVNAFTVT
jgi:hypothetical protein